MKTERFYIEFLGIDTPLSTSIRISKAEYQKQFSFLLRKVKEQQPDTENMIEYRSQTFDNEKVTLTHHFFTVGTAETVLTAVGAKPGYCLK